MDFIKSLFGVGSSGHEKLTLEDKELGAFTALSNTGNRIVWRGSISLLQQEADLFLHGDQKELDAQQKEAIRSMLDHQGEIEAGIDEKLKEHFQTEGNLYPGWRENYQLFAVSALPKQITLTMEDKHSQEQLHISFNENRPSSIMVDND